MMTRPTSRSDDDGGRGRAVRRRKASKGRRRSMHGTSAPVVGEKWERVDGRGLAGHRLKRRTTPIELPLRPEVIAMRIFKKQDQENATALPSQCYKNFLVLTTAIAFAWMPAFHEFFPMPPHEVVHCIRIHATSFMSLANPNSPCFWTHFSSFRHRVASSCQFPPALCCPELSAIAPFTTFPGLLRCQVCLPTSGLMPPTHALFQS
ncbi:hypothetical protein KSP40_PGU020508 [Platanthera guangdongensis]|uniref:Uncharacterized protein n=1 Tax=Platanthera guangdongensis TaxID=2320717 RepID=A0ABR2MAU2_9ASPA